MKAIELAGWLGAKHEGNGELRITGVADLAAAGGSDLSFVYGAKAAAHAERSAAGCLLVPEEFPKLVSRTVIRVKDPRAEFVKAVYRFHPPHRPEPGVHPTAVVSETAELGEAVAIGANTIIGDRVRIGANTVIGAGCHIGSDVALGDDGLVHDNVTIYPDTTIGNNVVLHSGVVLGADGFGFVMTGDHYEKFPQIGRLRVGDHVEIGANSCVDRGALGETVIGNGVKLDNLVHIAHNCSIGNHVVIAAQTGLSGGAIIEEYVVVAGQVGLGEKAHIESRAVLGGQCGVLPQKTVRSGETVWGTPARPIREYLSQMAQANKVGLLRKDVADLKKRVRSLESDE